MSMTVFVTLVIWSRSYWLENKKLEKNYIERAERVSQHLCTFASEKCFTYRPETREKAINDCEQANFMCVSETCDSSQYFVGDSHSLSVQCVLMFVTLVIILWSCSWRFIPTRNFPETQEKPINGCERAERASRNSCTFASETYIYIYIYIYISSCARQKDVNACARQKNWQCEDFACSQQKDVTDKTPTI